MDSPENVTSKFLNNGPDSSVSLRLPLAIVKIIGLVIVNERFISMYANLTNNYIRKQEKLKGRIEK